MYIVFILGMKNLRIWKSRRNIEYFYLLKRFSSICHLYKYKYALIIIYSSDCYSRVKEDVQDRYDKFY